MECLSFPELHPVLDCHVLCSEDDEGFVIVSQRRGGSVTDCNQFTKSDTVIFLVPATFNGLRVCDGHIDDRDTIGTDFSSVTDNGSSL